MKVPPGGLHPAVGMHSEGEEVQLHVNAVWESEESMLMAVDHCEDDWKRLHDVRLCGLVSNYNNGIQWRSSRFLTISSLCRELSPIHTLKWPGHSCVQITCNTWRAYHVQHVVLHAMGYEGTAQLLSLIIV